MSADEELRDLLPEEAEELKAFLEKRRWFEGKLKVILMTNLPLRLVHHLN